MAELWKFRSRMQTDGETITEFVTALQREAKYCKFQDYLPKALRNQLVFGLRNQRIRTRLFKEKDLTFDKAKQISLAMEASGEGAEVLNRRMHEVNLMDRKKRKRQPVQNPAQLGDNKVSSATGPECYRCGSLAHLANGLPTLSALRMQHYAVYLQSFNFEIRCRPSKEHANADGMSRLPLPDTSAEKRVEEIDVVEVNQIQMLPLSVEELQEHVRKDATVQNLIQALKSGRCVDGRDRFGVDQSEFTLQRGCLMRGIRVYIPAQLRARVLEELHFGHFGVSRMKSLARSYCWWETIDRDITDLARDCTSCARTRNNPAKAPVHCWERPLEPFQRVHADFAGPFMGVYFLIIVDAYSKWPEVKAIPDMTTETTIDRMLEFFATFGLPSVLVTDRGTQFMSELFQTFLKKNGIVHKTGAPYHPATNGQAERNVQTFKDKIKTLQCSRPQIQTELYNILMAYRRTVHPVTGKSRSMLVFGRQMRSRIDLMIPSVEGNSNSRGEEKAVRSFEINDRVVARDFLSKSEKWRFVIVAERMGKLHYMVELDDGRMWKRHIDQLQPGPVSRASHTDGLPKMETVIRNTISSIPNLTPNVSSSTLNKQPSSLDPVDSHTPRNTASPNSDTQNEIASGTKSNRVVENGNEFRRRSSRMRKPPVSLDL
ncbi:uncharacterized protein K02A2.6-like [Topomyia yanbarensis]|uniref:uncharacterized protein K02A2.6-like n=1 Tax=Topomyia yanbarensis TaxID=2498891 RepID=UPI00273B0044|nr:uncharacterized protein K02A2.6-like [Topomyia yanbarensis]